MSDEHISFFVSLSYTKNVKRKTTCRSHKGIFYKKLFTTECNVPYTKIPLYRLNVVCWLFYFLFQQMTQHDINFVAEFLRDNFNHFTLVRIMWSFVNGSDDFMCLIHVKGICKSKTFLCNFCVNGDMFIILWFTEICYLQYKQYVNCENIWNPFPFLQSVEKEIF